MTHPAASTPDVQRWAAFTDAATGGNPAGVVLDAGGLDDDAMQRIAAEVGYAETAFVTTTPDGARAVRYFSPIAEVPFCGHATVAAALALADTSGDGSVTFATAVGPVTITTATDARSRRTATFTSVQPRIEPLPDATVERALGALGLAPEHLDPRFPPMVAFAGNRHPVLVIADAGRFDGFRIDAGAARALMDEERWPATITVMHLAGEARWIARNVFPVGEIIEDPATGSAAAAFGGYLRALGLVPPATITIEQGAHVGRPGLLEVSIPPHGGIAVSGTGVRIPSPQE